MSEPQKTPRRRGSLPKPVTARDAVNTTMYVSGTTPAQVQNMIQARDAARYRNRFKMSLEELKQYKRNQYRAANPDTQLMSDQQIDNLVYVQEHSKPQPTISQGRSEAQRAIDRQNGLLYTQEDMDMAERLAEIHNASFLGGMVAPPISPQFARQHPGYVRGVIRDNAMVLPNAFLAGATFGLPSASGAFATGFRQGWNTAGNYALRAGNAVAQGGKYVLPVVTNPRYAMTAAATTVPFIVEAANEAGSGHEGGTPLPWLIGGIGSAGAGYLLYRLGKGRKPSTKVKDPTGRKLLTWWEPNPTTYVSNKNHRELVSRYNIAVSTGDRATIDAIKTKLYGADAATPKIGKGTRAKDNPKFISDTDLALALQNRTYPVEQAPFSYRRSSNAWRQTRNGLRLGLYGGAAGLTGWGLYEAFSPSSTPNPTDSDTAPTDTTSNEAKQQEAKQQEAAQSTVRSDSTRFVPLDSYDPMQEEADRAWLDSLNALLHK